MLNIFRNGILNRSSIDDLVEEIREYTIGDDDSLGRLERYTKQVNSDTVSQYMANYTKLLNDNEGHEFYVYLGNHQPDTRCFCDERYGKYYHKKEIEAWGDGSVGDCGFPWAGMIKGTNSSNIFTYRGGWNCQHQLVPTLVTRVPKDVIIRNIENGNYIPTLAVKKFFGLVA